MKSVFISIFFMVFSAPTNLGEVLTYTGVVTIENTSQDELYFRARAWFATTYVNSNMVIQMDSKESGQLIGRAKFIYEPKVLENIGRTRGVISYVIKVFLKDSKYKYEITDFTHEPFGNAFGKFSFGVITTDSLCNCVINPGADYWKEDLWLDIKRQIEIDANGTIKSLNRDMAKSTQFNSED